jgi:hypothetical protein
VIAFVSYFAIVLGILPVRSFMSFASLALDAGLSFAFVTIIAAIFTARRHRSSRSQLSLCAVTGVIMLALSALALYATRYI